MKRLVMVLMVAALALPALGQDFATQRLNKSRRHHEWVVVKNGTRDVHCFVVFPEVKDKATAVLVIHENKGLTDWVRSAADQFAEAGYVAIAPDMLSGLGPKGGKTSDFPSLDEATKVLYTLPPAQVTGDLKAAADYILKQPAVNGKLAVAGFCWGGGQTFRMATDRPDIKAAFVFYGPAPDKAALAKIQCPVYGFYGENDARINAGIPDTAKAMKDLNKTYEPVKYTGAGHGFMRGGEDPAGTAADRKARTEAWERVTGLLKKI